MPGIDKLPIEETLEDSPQVRGAGRSPGGGGEIGPSPWAPGLALLPSRCLPPRSLGGTPDRASAAAGRDPAAGQVPSDLPRSRGGGLAAGVAAPPRCQLRRRPLRGVAPVSAAPSRLHQRFLSGVPRADELFGLGNGLRRAVLQQRASGWQPALPPALPAAASAVGDCFGDLVLAQPVRVPQGGSSPLCPLLEARSVLTAGYEMQLLGEVSVGLRCCEWVGARGREAFGRSGTVTAAPAPDLCRRCRARRGQRFPAAGKREGLHSARWFLLLAAATAGAL